MSTNWARSDLAPPPSTLVRLLNVGGLEKGRIWRWTRSTTMAGHMGMPVDDVAWSTRALVLAAQRSYPDESCWDLLTLVPGSARLGWVLRYDPRTGTTSS